MCNTPIIQAIRPKGYTGEIKNCPDQKEVPFETIESAYEAWAKEFFKNNPKKSLSHNGFNNVTQATIYGKSSWVTSFWFKDKQ